MEQYLMPGGFFVFMIGSLIIVNHKLSKRPTFGEANELYKDIKSCDVIHESINEKLECLPDIKTDVTRIKTILEERNKK